MLHEAYYSSRGSVLAMQRKILVMAIGISFLLVLPAAVIRPTTATAAPTGLYGAYWLNSFFGSPAPTWPTCPTASTPVPAAPAGSPSGHPPTVTETDPNINFGSTTGFYWDESPPGGFAVTQGGYGVALSSWGDASDYPSSTQFVNVDFTVEWTGYISLTAGTTYYFQLESDDGSMLYINPTPGSSAISSGDSVAGYWTTEGPGNFATGSFKGSGTTGVTYSYAIEVDYFETCDYQSGIDLSWSTASPTSGFTIVPTTVFTPAQLGSNAPTTPSGAPEFGLAAPVVAAISLLAFAVMRKRTFRRTNATA